MQTNEWEIQIGDNTWSEFSTIIRSVKKLQYIRLQNYKNIWASKDHIFYVDGVATKVHQLKKYGFIDSIFGPVRYEKSIRFKTQYSYDVVECKANHQYIINDGILTHNCDEFAFVNPAIAEEFWTSISPTLATGGRAIISSTPNGDTNLFASLWRGAEMGTNGFIPIFVPWDAPPDRDEAFKQKQIAKIGLLKWRQEYGCEFLSSDPLLIDSMIMDEYKRDKINKLPPPPDARGFRFYKPIDRNQTYIIGVDPATGIGTDYSVIQLFSFPQLEQIMEFRSNTTSTPLLYSTLKALLLMMEQKGVQTVYMSIENNGIGEGMLTAYQLDESTPNIGELISEKGSKRLGMTTTGKSKSKACINFKQLFEHGKLHIHSMLLITEMQNYIRSGGSYNARSGATDDCISAVLIVIRVVEELMYYEEGAFDLLYGGADGGSVMINEFGEVQNVEPEAMLIKDYANIPSQYQIRGGFWDPNDINSFDPWYGMDENL